MQSAQLDDFVERVSERSDIYSVVSRYVPLTQKSGRYWGCCPFHNEKTASFSVSADKGLFYCFGCGAGGNVFKFLSLIENITYFEAIKLQAQRLGIDLPERRVSPEEERRRRAEMALIKINEMAQGFYYEWLTKSTRGEVGRKYLAARGITAETIETFKMGYAPDEWEDLFRKLTQQGFEAAQIETVGLIAKRRNASGYYDRFRDRVMIPITNVFGHVVGFGGRILTAKEDSPKYLNTPETVLFNKRKLLFGLDKSNRAISSSGAAIVVEGYMDAISLFSAGIENVVATLGTAFTPEHVKLILRYARKIIFCYDSDEAGQRATMRALPIVQESGADVFIVNVPDGKDPDEFVRKHGKEAFAELIKNATTLIDYHMKHVFANSERTTPTGKIEALQEIFPVIAKAKSEIELNEYLKKIAAALALDEFLVRNAWKTFSSKKEPHRKSAVVIAQTEPSNKKNFMFRNAVDQVLKTLWHDDGMLGYVLAILSRETFSGTQQEIIALLEDCMANGMRPNQTIAATKLSEEANAELARILMNATNAPATVEGNVFIDSVKFLQHIILNKKYHELLAQAEEYASNDKAAYVKTVQESLKIKKEMDNLKKKGKRNFISS